MINGNSDPERVVWLLDFNPASSKGTRKMGWGKINPRKKHVLQSVVASHEGDIEARMGKPRKNHVLQSVFFSFFPPSLPPTGVTSTRMDSLPGFPDKVSVWQMLPAMPSKCGAWVAYWASKHFDRKRFKKTSWYHHQQARTNQLENKPTRNSKALEHKDEIWATPWELSYQGTVKHEVAYQGTAHKQHPAPVDVVNVCKRI